jgi:hypothetical protein
MDAVPEIVPVRVHRKGWYQRATGKNQPNKPFGKHRSAHSLRSFAMVLNRIDPIPALEIDCEGITNSEGLLEPAKFMTHLVNCHNYFNFND